MTSGAFLRKYFSQCELEKVLKIVHVFSTLFSRAICSVLGEGEQRLPEEAQVNRDKTTRRVIINFNKLGRLPGVYEIVQIGCNNYDHPFQTPESSLLKNSCQMGIAPPIYIPTFIFYIVIANIMFVEQGISYRYHFLLISFLLTSLASLQQQG